MMRLVFIGVWALLLPSCVVGSKVDRTCDVDGMARTVAGAGATDCGRVFARYDVPGIDSIVARLFAGDAEGRVFILLWDSDPSGGSGAHETVDQWECVSPTVDSALTHIECASGGEMRRVCQ
jgi:hypothetical protein